MPPTDEVRDLLARASALARLLACYRTGSRPTEKLFRELEATRLREEEIRKAHGL